MINKPQFAKIYDNYVDKIYRFCYLKVNSREDAEDLTSETFLKLLNHFKENKEEIKNIQAFVYQIARNLITDYYREKGKSPLPLEEDLLKEGEIPRELAPQKSLILDSDMKEVSRALIKINPDLADLVIWHYIDGLSIPEISKINGKPEGTNRVALHRALQTLKRELETK